MMLWLSILLASFFAGYMTHIMIMEVKRIYRIHNILNLPPPTEDEMEAYEAVIANNRKANIEENRSQIRIVK